MAKDNAQSWEKIEEQAYHAFREWSIWLLLRQGELSQHLQQANTPTNPAATTATDPHQQPKRRKKSIRRNS